MHLFKNNAHESFQGDDLEGLLFHFLDEWLFIFSADDFFIRRKIVITEFDMEAFRIKAIGYGGAFDLDKHPQENIENKMISKYTINV